MKYGDVFGLTLAVEAVKGEDLRRLDWRAGGVSVFEGGLGERARLRGVEVEVVALDAAVERARGMANRSMS